MCAPYLNLQEKEMSTLPIRDALTVARMEDRERASVSRLTSKMGLDMTNAAEVRQGCRPTRVHETK